LFLLLLHYTFWHLSCTQVMALSFEDTAVYEVMAGVMNMTADDTALLNPQMMLKVLAFKGRKWWKQVTGGKTQGQK
jgi:hypothetical protein